MITLKKLQLFFNRIGYDWKGEMLNKDSVVVQAKSFGDVKSEQLNLTTLRLYQGQRRGDVLFHITDTSMKHYKKKVDAKHGTSYLLINDLSKMWRTFLKEKEHLTGIDLEALTKNDWKDFVSTIQFYLLSAFNTKNFSVKIINKKPQQAIITFPNKENSTTLNLEMSDEHFQMYVDTDKAKRYLHCDYIQNAWKKFISRASDFHFEKAEV